MKSKTRIAIYHAINALIPVIFYLCATIILKYVPELKLPQITKNEPITEQYIINYL